MLNNRPDLFIYPKDVTLFTRKTERHAATLLEKIRTKLGKEKHQPITVTEFCTYIKLDVEHVYTVLKGK